MFVLAAFVILIDFGVTLVERRLLSGEPVMRGRATKQSSPAEWMLRCARNDGGSYRLLKDRALLYRAATDECTEDTMKTIWAGSPGR